MTQRYGDRKNQLQRNIISSSSKFKKDILTGPRQINWTLHLQLTKASKTLQYAYLLRLQLHHFLNDYQVSVLSAPTTQRKVVERENSFRLVILHLPFCILPMRYLIHKQNISTWQISVSANFKYKNDTIQLDINQSCNTSNDWNLDILSC